MLTLPGFRALFGAFSAVPDGTVEARLAEAAAEIDPAVWGEQADAGHGWRTAELLAASGYGGEVAKGGMTSYGRRFAELRDRVGAAYRVVLD